MTKQEIINNFLEKLEKDNYSDMTFSTFYTFCKKCGSFNVEESYDGDGGPVCAGAYTASFDGSHFIKCIDCGNAMKRDFSVNINGAFEI
jgi:hypothetical protein